MLLKIIWYQTKINQILREVHAAGSSFVTRGREMSDVNGINDMSQKYSASEILAARRALSMKAYHRPARGVKSSIIVSINTSMPKPYMSSI